MSNWTATNFSIFRPSWIFRNNAKLERLIDLLYKSIVKLKLVFLFKWRQCQHLRCISATCCKSALKKIIFTYFQIRILIIWKYFFHDVRKYEKCFHHVHCCFESVCKEKESTSQISPKKLWCVLESIYFKLIFLEKFALF